MCPQAPFHPCHQPGCGELLPRGQAYCTEHQKDSTKNYDKGRPSYHSLYHTARWKALRARQLFEHPFCVECDQLANLVDHIIEHRGDEKLFFDEANLQSMCIGCHNIKHSK